MKFILMVGPPGSGKTTIVNELCQHDDFVVISTDDIYVEWGAELGLSYNESFKVFNYKEIEREMFKRMKEAFGQNKNVILDQTNMTRNSRKHKLSKVPSTYQKIAEVVEVSTELLEQQLQTRFEQTGKYIPPSVVTQMIDSYQRPSSDEGFSDVRIHTRTI